MTFREITKKRLEETYPLVKVLLNKSPELIGTSSPPSEKGVYIFFDEDNTVSYVGQAASNKGLKDRIKSKHVSGDESHALQRAFLKPYPDRLKRREYIKSNISVAWVVVDDINAINELEHFLIWLYTPKWNRQ